MMIEDPAGGRMPYAALAPVGVTPWTSHAEMQDVSFELQGRGLMSPRTQQAWNELRSTRRRLLIDLLMYDIGEFGAEAEEAVSSGVGVPPVWAGRLLDELIRFDR
ncbi:MULTISPECIES: hypothetical protein [Streptomyces]|uniref:Uncharacterized protein n=1 Tax=Streptomyces spinosisporus TaxID=2927582 RepID=A0ABS9X9R2_9ACTN|nr:MULTISPECIES: hypothetical protein [Streptomyces]EPD66473.1 hypothetical protein HMPREF1211_01997 [Streptomyces sp. HGB0020]MCI3238372.1 hypothetical protein [Streptomyces spinosisporus]WUB35224.1 hypothetical protein OHN38_09995 [Streptomyces sp. NBC_00588]